MPSHLPVVIAAAGLGSRLGQGKPKALVEVGGRSIIERMLTDCLADEKDIRVVVGFHEQAVIQHVLGIRQDIIFIRNPDYRDSSASHSFALAARAISGPMIILDGDLLIKPESWRSFAQAATRSDMAATSRERSIIGVTPAKTEDAVFVRTRQDASGGALLVEHFTRKERHPYEWCGVACVDKSVFEMGRHFVYECCEPSLPLPAFVLDIAEIDTPADLATAQAWLGATA
jgi:choline kinase